MVIAESHEVESAGSAPENVLRSTYTWINRLLWPIVSGISGLTAYWTFVLPHADIAVLVGGCVFGVFAGMGMLNALLWWSDEDGSS